MRKTFRLKAIEFRYSPILQGQLGKKKLGPDFFYLTEPYPMH